VKKRSKLNLSPEAKQRKAMASGFGNKVASDPEGNSDSKSSHEPKQNHRPKPQHSRQHARVNQNPSGSASITNDSKLSRKLMMAAAVAATSVVALYIIKRR
jgi:hypothetical protein